jgi:hypothetical protein
MSDTEIPEMVPDEVSLLARAIESALVDFTSELNRAFANFVRLSEANRELERMAQAREFRRGLHESMKTRRKTQ